VLGINDPIWLGFPDAPFRNIIYSSFLRIILGEQPGDHKFMEKVSARINMLYEKMKPKTVFVPLAVGTHIDHRNTHQIWRKLPSEANIAFYEDRPYSLLPNNLALRLRQIGARPVQSEAMDIPATFGSNELRDFNRGLKTITFYKNILTNNRERFRYVLQIARKFKLKYAELAFSPTFNIDTDTITTDNIDELRQIGKAISAYKSQFGTLYGNIETFEKESATYARTLGATALYAERYWRLLR
jgi:LmbE family N-acetylglucosaminyl deacetylase